MLFDRAMRYKLTRLAANYSAACIDVMKLADNSITRSIPVSAGPAK
jgi:hypothetical protein